MIKIIGLMAAFLTTSSFLPQAIKTIKTKDTSGISFFMYLLFTTGVLLWLIYGAVIKDFPVFIANLITLIFALVIFVCKVINMKKGKVTFLKDFTAKSARHLASAHI